ncbi:uncharacterized protein B0T15DRAFT_522251 [Chaetomium strumarium]|uniref:DUF7587 domain-containing protein n=1 Tax=Chaetomium strumarium TaxID=1170767 RepID=A0AAJ0M7A4_9PEZI|nr:hypothetical protein B0T15DRAFT_522251 [Chaetomium strumarium]
MESSADAKYTVSQDSLPEVLWRVTRPIFQRTQRVTGELWARDMPKTLLEREDLLRNVRNHFDWSSLKHTCFVSVFTDEDHARCWANKLRVYHGHQPMCRTRIIAALLPDDIRIFDARKLREDVGPDLMLSQGELLFFSRIPWQSLGRTGPFDETLAPIKDCKSLGVESLRNMNDVFGCLLRAVSESRVQACDEADRNRPRRAKAELTDIYRQFVDKIGRW